MSRIERDRDEKHGRAAPDMTDVTDVPDMTDVTGGRSGAVSALRDELRADDGPDLDFDRMEAALMARVATEGAKRTLRARATMGAVALSMVAAAALMLARVSPLGADAHGRAGNERATRDAVRSGQGAGALESGDANVRDARGAEIRLGRGESLHRGESLETSHALFRSPGRVVYSVAGAISVSETDRPIVLSLARGVVEAQVDKVESGEAFAVDLAGDSGNVRIAVHGTHLRVARDGAHVTLDLTEGIVNVGRPPKSGSTYGKLVTAPAHVEFDVNALDTSFTMTKDAHAVRAAEDLSASTALEDSRPTVVAPPGAALTKTATMDAPVPSLVVARDVRPAAVPFAKDATAQPKDPGVVLAPPEAHADPRVAVNDAVIACAREKLHADQASQPAGKPEVTLTVASTLSLRVGDDGYVRAARFEPPLDPEVQRCAATTIYKTRFSPADGASVTIPVSVVQR